ncbi:hypothetical protein HDU81_007727 [Chytriomyces hyalinus]|nr:hypothetical protein HDU81_007727 [Chytriomyces hyalinus]
MTAADTTRNAFLHSSLKSIPGYARVLVLIVLWVLATATAFDVPSKMNTHLHPLSAYSDRFQVSPEDLIRLQAPSQTFSVERKMDVSNNTATANATMPNSLNFAKSRSISLSSPPLLNARGCPPPKAALIGVPSLLSFDNAVRRKYLRDLYTKYNQILPEASQIDFKFMYGISSKPQFPFQMALERLSNPNDTLTTSHEENMNKGKTLDWFLFARNLSYTAHPTRAGKWCQKYLYVGKTDDDAVIHVPRLSARLQELAISKSSQYIGRVWGKTKKTDLKHMTGMLYVVSLDVLEWMYSNPKKTPVSGVLGEDLQFSRWITDAQLDVEWVDETRFHDRPRDGELSGWSPAPITNQTIVVHYCKTPRQFFRCIMKLFENEI